MPSSEDAYKIKVLAGIMDEIEDRRKELQQLSNLVETAQDEITSGEFDTSRAESIAESLALYGLHGSRFRQAFPVSDEEI